MRQRIVVHIEVESALEVLGIDHLPDDELLRHLIEIVSPADVLDGAKWRIERWRPSLDALARRGGGVR